MADPNIPPVVPASYAARRADFTRELLSRAAELAVDLEEYAELSELARNQRQLEAHALHAMNALASAQLVAFDNDFAKNIAILAWDMAEEMFEEGMRRRDSQQKRMRELAAKLGARADVAA